MKKSFITPVLRDKFTGIKFTIKNFKSLKEEEINLDDITVVAGANSTGKSSIPQAILTWFQLFKPPVGYGPSPISRVSNSLDVPLTGKLVKNPPIHDLKNNKAKSNENVSFSCTYPILGYSNIGLIDSNSANKAANILIDHIKSQGLELHEEDAVSFINKLSMDIVSGIEIGDSFPLTVFEEIKSDDNKIVLKHIPDFHINLVELQAKLGHLISVFPEERSETISIELTDSDKGQNYAKIEKITSEALGLEFSPNEKKVKNTDIFFLPFKGTSEFGESFSKESSIAQSLCKEFMKYDKNSQTFVKQSGFEEVIPVVARDIKTNKVVQDIYAIEHSGGVVTQIYLRAPLHKVWHSVFEKMISELDVDIDKLIEFEAQAYVSYTSMINELHVFDGPTGDVYDYHENELTAEPGDTMLEIIEEFFNKNLIADVSETNFSWKWKEIKFQPNTTKFKTKQDEKEFKKELAKGEFGIAPFRFDYFAEEYIDRFIEGTITRTYGVTSEIEEEILAGEGNIKHSPDSGPYVHGQKNKHIIYSEEDKKILRNLAMDYDNANELDKKTRMNAGPDSEKGAFFRRQREDALKDIRMKLEHIMKTGAGKEEIPKDLLFNATKNIIEAFFLENRGEFPENPYLEISGSYEILNIFAEILMINYYEDEGISLIDGCVDKWQQTLEEVKQQKFRDFSWGTEEVNQKGANMVDTGLLNGPTEMYLRKQLQEFAEKTDFFRKVVTKEIFSDKFFRDAFKEVYKEGIKDIIIPIKSSEYSSLYASSLTPERDESIKEIIYSWVKKENITPSLNLEEAITYLAVDSLQNPLYAANIRFVSARPENISKAIESVREKLSNNETGLYKTLNKTVDEDIQKRFSDYKENILEGSNPKLGEIMGEGMSELAENLTTEFSFAKRFEKFLKYLGLAESIEIKEEAFGSLEIRYGMNSGENPIREISVGSGVSQAVPIIEALMEVTKEVENSLLFLEEPETHLHPSAQQKLADILFELGETTNIYIETHSEYIINRLRLRQLEREVSGEKGSSVNINFVELNDGETQLKPLIINEFGAIENWPKGFFDQSMEDGQRLLELGLEKKNRAKNTENDEN